MPKNQYVVAYDAKISKYIRITHMPNSLISSSHLYYCQSHNSMGKYEGTHQQNFDVLTPMPFEGHRAGIQTPCSTHFLPFPV